ncbi:MFS transporter [Sciscionella marina]|uniref:MFS transporter n=1 Tax=Sciscionella marina TaxID=508770 RepID=UPI0003A27F45|nr:MFS transporter [Sciscionella marina]
MSNTAARKEDVPESRMARRALVASAVGSAIEWYDFYVYGLSAALIFNHLFFPSSSAYSGTLLALSTFFAGFLTRPLGAMFFGHFGDRLGRRTVLIATTLMMGLGTFFVGLAPTHEIAGSWGAVILVVLRVVQGIGVGGDWGGSVLMATEWNSADGKRGLLGALPQFGSPLGLITATIVTEATNRLFPTGNYESFGWRILFLFSLLLTVLTLFLRLRVRETTSFSDAKKTGALRQAPVAYLLRHHWRTVIKVTLMRTGQNTGFYLFTTFVLSYGVTSLHRERSTMLVAVLLAAAVSLGTTLFWGAVSDRIGRKRIVLIGIVAMFCFAIPYYSLLDSGSTVLLFVGVVVSMIVQDMQYGPQGSFIAESFPADVRYSGASLGYQLTSITSGGPAPLIATALIATLHSSVAIAVYLMVTCVVAFVATMLLPGVDQRPAKQRCAAEESASVDPERV